jgi:hypothetical protein
MDDYRSKVFNAYYDLKCSDILSLTNICLPNGLPRQDLVLKNPKISSFLFEYARENIAVVNAFIKNPYYTLIKRDESMPTVAFLGNIGGILGLCMGLSIISLFEIFYHLVNFFHQQLALRTVLPAIKD